jgi:hypothetical protein
MPLRLRVIFAPNGDTGTDIVRAWRRPSLIRSLGRPAFGWGRELGLETAELRLRYRRALQSADADCDDLEALVRFARS